MKRESCLRKTKVLLQVTDNKDKERCQDLIAAMGGEITRSTTAHVVVASTYASSIVRVRVQAIDIQQSSRPAVVIRTVHT